MRIGAFEFEEPVPDLHEPHALVILDPWVDVGDVGLITMSLLENHFHAKPLGKLFRPGNFFDFTRYRPVIHLAEGQRTVEIPNSVINYAKQPDGNDFLFFHLLEPHMFGEFYADSVLRVLRKFAVKRYCLIGSMYDAVPHTKPIIVSGGSSGLAGKKLRKLNVQRSGYEGPTTIAILISQQAPNDNIEAMSLIAHLPQYVRVERDYAGVLRLIELLGSLYHFSLNLEETRRKAEKQNEELSLAMDREPQLKQIVEQLERYYEAQTSKVEEEQPKLSPQIEEFLRDVTKRFGQN